MNPELGKGVLHDLKGLYSSRLGDYRIIYRVFHEEITVLVLTLGHGEGIYGRMVRKISNIKNISLNEQETKG